MIDRAQPFVRIVRAGWPETMQAEVFAYGEREVIYTETRVGATMETLTYAAEEVLATKGLRVKGWTDIGPCCREAQIG